MRKGVNMQLSKIKFRNYRLLLDAELEVDSKTTTTINSNSKKNLKRESGTHDHSQIRLSQNAAITKK